MTTAAAELLAAALKLSPEEREDVAEELLHSLEPPESDIDRMTDEEFEAELNRRAEELRRDPSAGIPWEEARRQLFEEFGDAGHHPPAGQSGNSSGGLLPTPRKSRTGGPVRDGGC